MEHAKELLPVGRLNLAPSPFHVRWNAPGQGEAGNARIRALRLLHPLMTTEHAAEAARVRKPRFAVAVVGRRGARLPNQLCWRPAQWRLPVGWLARAGALNAAV